MYWLTKHQVVGPKPLNRLVNETCTSEHKLYFCHILFCPLLLFCCIILLSWLLLFFFYFLCGYFYQTCQNMIALKSCNQNFHLMGFIWFRKTMKFKSKRFYKICESLVIEPQNLTYVFKCRNVFCSSLPAKKRC